MAMRSAGCGVLPAVAWSRESAPTVREAGTGRGVPPPSKVDSCRAPVGDELFRGSTRLQQEQGKRSTAQVGGGADGQWMSLDIG